ncbi:MAG: UDP-2,4-diacetamido-2,4, 6-trideoxy-beta-L-altropyranose hydrolase [Bacteroidota bacterium]|jgi:UDP-2,4-diacetamido-2,4,6-trideoxy-beta-L-altropyranose hydrolase|nr:UDP-2,4-diacetamido-2,4, 6-trideoxy-beta-L-altropyranose hydrolase [Bacteroidota bacterium]
MGHIIRSLALADILKNEFNVVFAIQTPSNSILKTIHQIVETVIHLPGTGDYTQDCNNLCDYLNTDMVVVIDGYNFRTDYQKRIKEKGCKVIVIDDLFNWHHVADAIINHADEVDILNYSKEDYTRLFTGLEYALLRKEFLSTQKRKRTITSIKKIFISMGAADINNLTSRFCKALIEIKGIEEIHLMLGSINPHLNEVNEIIKSSLDVKIIPHFNISAEELSGLLNECDLCICPASSISLESCAVGIPLLSGHTADNQRNILMGLEKHKAALNAGDFNTIETEEIKKIINEIKENSTTLNSMISNQADMIDGKSPQRLLEIFKNI